jgi:hypothetical protein
MSTMTHPLKLRMSGDKIAELHAALAALDRRVAAAERKSRRFGASTRDAVRDLQERHGLRASGEVDEQTAKRIDALLADRRDENRVVGRVVRADGTLIAGAKLALFREGIAKPTPLGAGSATKTDSTGSYTFCYPRPERPFDLRIELQVDPNLGVDATKPRIIAEAGQEERADFVVGDAAFRGLSLFERLERSVAEALRDEGIVVAKMAGFDEQQLARLALKTGIDPRTLVLLRQSHALAKETRLSAAVLFGMGRQKMPLGLTALLAQDPARRRAAVKAAISANDMPAKLERQAADVLERLDSIAVADSLKQPAAPGLTTLGKLLGTAAVAPAKQQQLVDAYVKHNGTNPEFWKKVATDGVLSSSEVAAVQLTLQLGAVTHNHAPLVAALKTRGIDELEKLATLDKSDWRDLIEGTAGAPGAGLPADFRAAGLTVNEYVETMFRIVEDAFVQRTVVHRLASFPEPQLLGRFFALNPEFDLRTTPVRAYLEAHPTALDAFAGDDRKGLERRLKGLERAYRIAPPGARVETMQTLLSDGFDSAQKVRTLGRTAFVRRYTPSMGRERAEKVWTRSNNVSALATIVLARHSALFDRTPIEVLPRRVEALEAMHPSYEQIFGSLDFCCCEHCESVFGPAAYLVDVLHWLDNRPAVQPSKTALDVLFDARRADIGNIELSCANTNTPMPYLDLVNEVLELAVAPLTPRPAYQTTSDAADLLAHPEHVHEEAYSVLAGARAAASDGKDAVYPFNLPFNLWIEEARSYLGQLGVPRYRLMEVLTGDAAARVDPIVAAETLALSPLEWDVIAGKPLGPSRTTAAFWGMAGDASFLDTLQQVSRLLDQATPPIVENSTEFAELADLLRTDFVQAVGPIGVWFKGLSCDTTKAQLVGLTEAGLERMHRFVRLRRRLAWSAADLDRAIHVLGGGVLDEPCLIRLGHVRRLAGQLQLPVAELLGWWGLLDTRRWSARLRRGVPPGAPSGVEGTGMVFDNTLTTQPERGEHSSPYDRLFQGASMSADPTAAFGVNAAGTALADETGRLLDHLPEIAGALGVTAESLGELLPRLHDDVLSLRNLSALFRHVSLAKAARLNARELVSMLALTGLDPFDPAHTENALALLDDVAAVRASGFSIAELEYLLSHKDAKPGTLEPDDADIGVLLLELGAALRGVETDHPPPAAAATASDLREQLRKELATVLAAGAVEAAMAIVDVTAGSAPPVGAATFLQDKLGSILDAADATPKLVDQSSSAYLTDAADRLAYALTGVVAHIRRLSRGSIVIEKLASAVRLDPALVAPLLREHLKHPDAAGRLLASVFADDAVRDYRRTQAGSAEPILPSAADLPEQVASFKRLHKAALLLTRLRIGRHELGWVLEQGPARGTLDVQDLPVTASAAAYRGFARLRDAVELRDRLSTRAVFDLLEAAAAAESGGAPAAKGAAHEALLTDLARRTRWDAADIEFLVGTPARGSDAARPGALGFAYPADWQDERPLRRLADVMSVVRRLGLSAEVLWPWRKIPVPADTTPDAEAAAIEAQAAQARDIKQAVRARHDESQWREVARSLRERLSERQRDMLVGWLVGNDERFVDASALFAHFLLDVEMSACQLTSRIKQAISAVQLFVQRALMGLEVDAVGAPLVDLSADDGAEWEWMKSYRVWEANRKVFLYPENWLEPQLRDDKTPFFVELEDELLQQELTAESVERAVRGYLDKVDLVARLEVVGHFHQKDESTDVLHVIGRTRGTPPVFYYRRRFDASHWSPWETIDVDVEGDHVVPVVFHRRLFLFWLQITDAAVEKAPAAISSNPARPPQPERPIRYFQIRLLWSQLRSGGWTSKKLARPFIGEHVVEPTHVTGAIAKTPGSTPADFFVRAVEEAQGDLLIEPIRRRRSSSQRSNVMYLAIDNGINDVDLPPEMHPGDSELEPTDSIVYLRLPRFRVSGCDDSVTLEGTGGGSVTVRTPPITETSSQTFARATGTAALALPARHTVTSAFYDEPTLDTARAPFEVVPSHIDDFQSREPFFFQDLRRTFFVEPRVKFNWTRPRPDWSVAANSMLEVMRMLPATQPPPGSPLPDPAVFDPAAVAALPDFSIALPARKPVASPTLGVGALSDTFGAEVAYIGGKPVTPKTTDVALGWHVRVIDSAGRDLAQARTGMPPADAAELGGIVVGKTLVMPALTVPEALYGPQLISGQSTRYRFESFYHPYVCTMTRELNRFGLAGLFNPDADGPEALLRRQAKQDEYFQNEYAPRAVLAPFPKDEFDFSFGGSYAIYNWEVFFHVPFLIACNLSKNQRFAEARRWFHFIFDPTETDGDAPQRFWKVKPLFELFLDETAQTGPIHELLLLLQYQGTEPDKLAQRDELLEQVARWRADPFSPHALARLRLATYARAVVMKYIDNLIEWGDQLFRRDTLESINEASQLYVLAAQILGRRPRRVDVEPIRPRTFGEVRADLDAFGNALVEEIEGLLPETTETANENYDDDVNPLGSTLLFCIPPNDKLLTDYWDRVADRLFKLRHCMNIEGVVRQLPLFEPPIDPALLVQAKALGVDLASALSDLNAPLPRYRYQVLAQKASELCAEVRALGQGLLAALEKRDSEALALVRAGHEVKLQNAVRDVRTKQVGEAQELLDGLLASKQSVELRRDYYRSRSFMNAAEIAQAGFLAAAGLLDATAQGIQAVAAIVSNVPNNESGGAGFGGSPVVTFSFGGMQLSFSAQAAASSLKINASIADRLGQLSGLIGSYSRRRDDWSFQGDSADKEIDVVERQIAAARVRVAIAQRELANLDLQVEQSTQVEEFLRDKYSNDRLYQWMVGQLSSVYFQAYQLAYDMAKRAQRAWQYELAMPDTSFVEFGYWDGLKKGLLAGERLHHDLKRMDSAYLEQNRREYEITKHVSMSQLDALAFVRLREEGRCTLSIPEVIFDFDHPGHYLRRIKSVALTIPCVTGPYTSLNCTLTLLKSAVRHAPTLLNGAYSRTADDPRFTDSLGAVESIVTSNGQADAGLFDVNLRDERYLPFEGAGAISEWLLELPTEFRSFDYRTISDVVLHVRYTARSGGSPLKERVAAELRDAVNDLARTEGQGLARLFRLRHEFPTEWHRFLNPAAAGGNNSITAKLDSERFPFSVRSKPLTVKRMQIVAKMNPKFVATHNAATIRVVLAAGDTAPTSSDHQLADLLVLTEDDGLLRAEKSFDHLPGKWTMTMWRDAGERVQPEAFDEIIWVCGYTVG